jgi:tetratricopeptide (TPR) repeat protein
VSPRANVSFVTALALVFLLHPAAMGSPRLRGDVNAGAFGASRPSECGLSEGFRATNAWERAKEPNLRRYCDLLASGTAKLVGTAARAKDVPAIADEADKLLPGRAAPSVLKGRALLRLGKAVEALAALGEAKKRDERALDDPLAGLVWARANARTGHPAEAVKAYRAALPRMSSATPQERAAASFEAGMAVMGQGPSALDDAIAMFRQARRDAQEALSGASVLALALALDRAGQGDEARAVLADLHADAAAIVADARVVLALADAGSASEADAFIAIGTADPTASREAWRRAADGKGPWAEHARARVEPGRKKGK